jgi:hypothetical protein
MITEGWKLKSEYIITPILPERPPQVCHWLSENFLTLLKLLDLTFQVEITLDNILSQKLVHLQLTIVLETESCVSSNKLSPMHAMHPCL